MEWRDGGALPHGGDRGRHGEDRRCRGRNGKRAYVADHSQGTDQRHRAEGFVVHRIGLDGHEPVNLVRGETTNAVRGEFTARDALDRMLAGSALIATYLGIAFIASSALRDPEIKLEVKNFLARRLHR